MFIWGRGSVIPLIAFGCALLTEFSTRTAFRDVTYYQTHGWPMLVDEKTCQQGKISLEAELFFALLATGLWPWMALGPLFFFYNAHRFNPVSVTSSCGG
jgi:hypothetical protein